MYKNVNEIPTEVLANALSFYKGQPTGEYDDEIVLLIEAELTRRDTWNITGYV